MNKMEKAYRLGKPLIYFSSKYQAWFVCYDSDYHKYGSYKAACDIIDSLNKRINNGIHPIR